MSAPSFRNGYHVDCAEQRDDVHLLMVSIRPDLREYGSQSMLAPACLGQACSCTTPQHCISSRMFTCTLDLIYETAREDTVGVHAAGCSLPQSLQGIGLTQFLAFVHLLVGGIQSDSSRLCQLPIRMHGCPAKRPARIRSPIHLQRQSMQLVRENAPRCQDRAINER